MEVKTCSLLEIQTLVKTYICKNSEKEDPLSLLNNSFAKENVSTRKLVKAINLSAFCETFLSTLLIKVVGLMNHPLGKVNIQYFEYVKPIQK